MRIQWTHWLALLLCAQPAAALEFTEALWQAGRTSENIDAEIDRLTREFPIEVDWLNQTMVRPQLDGNGRSKALRARLTASGQESSVQATLDAAKARRAQRLKNLRVEAPRMVFVKRHTVRPSFFGYTEGQSDGQREKHFHPGSALCMLDLSSGEPVVETLLDDPTGVIRDPDVSFDGKRILFAWKKGPEIEDDDYHLYEMDVETQSVRQVTHGKGVADYEGRYLPSGDLIFSSTRCVQTVDCYITEVSNLYTCDKDGNYIRRLGFDQVHTTYPNVLNDGRVVYTRWDYNDRGQVFPQPLFQMNADGTGQTEYYGNNSWFPTTISHVRAIPGSSKVVAVLMGHHTWQAGKLALIDRSKGTQEAEGVQLIAPMRNTEPVRIDAYGQDEELFRHPYALSETEFIVAMSPDKNTRHNANTRFGLYYIDADGNRELLVYDPDVSCAHPIALRPRPVPPVRPSNVDFAKDYGIYYVQDVYVGPGLQGVPRGTIKKLRVVALEYRAAPVGVVQSGGEAGGSHTFCPIACGNASWDTKVILGEVPVYQDGSAMFRVPAHTPVYFQCVDTNGHVAATMRSWSTLMPGETFGCVGCHENKMETPLSQKVTLAMQQRVAELQPFYDVSGRGFSFLKTIQPILDQHCVSCHDGKPRPDGKALWDLTDRMMTGGHGARKWTASYLSLTGTVLDDRSIGQEDRPLLNWISCQSRPDMLPPYHAGSATSEIIEMLRSGHGGTRLTRKEIDLFSAWIDLLVPFCGDYLEANSWHDADFNRYIHYQRKRERLAAEVRRNTEAFYFRQTGKTLKRKDPEPLFLEYVNERYPGYRNVALNARATSNSEYPHPTGCFAARHVVDGITENRGHGPKVPSWGPQKIDEPWLLIAFEQEAEIDKCVIYIRADFTPCTTTDHDSYWKFGTLEFSDGSSVPFELERTADPQVIEFPKRNVSSVRLAELVPAGEAWCALCEVEFWGSH